MSLIPLSDEGPDVDNLLSPGSDHTITPCEEDAPASIDSLTPTHSIQHKHVPLLSDETPDDYQGLDDSTSELDFEKTKEVSEKEPSESELTAESGDTKEEGEAPVTRSLYNNPIKQYLQSLRHHHVLTPEQERSQALRLVEARSHVRQALTALAETLTSHPHLDTSCSDICYTLAKRVRWNDGDILTLVRDTRQQLVSNELPSASQEQILQCLTQLQSAFHVWEQQREDFVNANLRLVVTLAKRFLRSGLPMSDLIGEGNTGLIRAIDLFNPEFGTRLSTYAVPWIKQAMNQASAAYSEASSPHTNRPVAQPTEQTGHHANEQPSSSTQKKKQFHRYINKSLDDPLGPDGESTISDLYPDTALPSPEVMMMEHQLKVTIHALLQSLPDKHRQILVLRFGLDNEEPLTIEQIATRLHMKREEVRAIQNKLRRDIKTGPMASRLQAFLLD